jgi:short-subunit dehydrogenase
MDDIMLYKKSYCFLTDFASSPDVVSQESIEKAAQDVDLLVQELGLNCLINNAGINVVANFETVTAEKMLENFHTNSVAPLMITKVSFVHFYLYINKNT